MVTIGGSYVSMMGVPSLKLHFCICLFTYFRSKITQPVCDADHKILQLV